MMDSPTDRQSAAFDKYWLFTYRIAIIGIVAWALLDREKNDPSMALGCMVLVVFLDSILGFIRWLNRRHDSRRAKRPPDAP
jgi:hypothetical protein